MTEKILHKKPNGFIALCAFLVLYIAALVVCCIGAAMLEDMTGAGFYAMLAVVIVCAVWLSRCSASTTARSKAKVFIW